MQTMQIMMPPPPAVAPPSPPEPVAPTARPRDANKAFVPPPGWSPPRQPEIATPAPRPASPPPVAAEPAPPPAPARARQADVNKAFVPPPGWSPPPAQVPAATQVATAPTAAPASVAEVPPASRNPNAAFVPPPGWTPPGGRPAVEVAAASPQASTPQPTRPSVGTRRVAVIQFAQMSSDLTATDMAILQRVAEIQRSNGGRVRIVAHAAEDAYGSSVAALAQGNLDVSRRRALAIAGQLVRLGVPRDRIVAEAASDAEPIYDPRTPRGVAANRRADITVEL